MEVIELQPEIDYVKIGQWIKSARLEHGYSQADLGALVGCSNNHMSHVEVGQTKVSLPMLLKLAYVLDKNFDYFLLDTPYAKCENIINSEIANKLNLRKKANWQKKRNESRSWCLLFHRIPFGVRDVPDWVRTMSIPKLCNMWWGAGCPVEIRLAPTVAERRTFRCTDHHECLQSYCREVSCGERDV